ncbi:LacI family DNA-binding transcriptional regulator [Homoserinibacter sp. YIM 151385]|uniref:LacI family DNA-binding transcriptional regulator n=1 Tax=Homoserinibacter sp. YIM 151385 TaxID=2985506 RepID=UPI0022F01B0F|nr:LacI family DNA-binding transcriptional regulator [Homoserinibacter sp. YIM 151385]WBU37332.1 LacI family DNA-binding transcriptional regulator [Homoserinibacter sp. YIM 151385]
MPSSRPTINDVAQRAGVSKGLVSLALNDRPGVSAASRGRILDVAAELGWTPSLRARSLSVDRSFSLGLVVARDPGVLAADPFFPAFIAGVEEELQARGLVLTLAMVPSEERELQTYRQLAGDRRVDGVFITDLRRGDPRIQLALELGLPAVTLGRPETASPHSSVAIDDGPGIRDAVEHLAGLGHRRIAHVAGPDALLHGARRRRCFEEAIAAAGLPGELVEPTDFSAAAGARATERLLAAAEPPTAIVYANDPMAIAGIGIAQSRGMRVPEQLSVTGFDGSDLGQYLYPPLTSVSTDVTTWGIAATRALLRRVDGGEPEELELEPARLIVRGSTAAPSR